MEILEGKHLSEDKKRALDVAEDARETQWTMPSFVARLFDGSFRWDLIHPYPEQPEDEKKAGDEFIAKLETFLKKNLDPDQVDRTGIIPEEVYRGLADLGCFSMKIHAINPIKASMRTIAR